MTHDLNLKTPKSKLTKWVDSLDGRTRVAKLLGVNPSTLYRWEVGELPVPEWLIKFMAMSEQLADLKQENAQLRRKNFFANKANKK